MRRRKLAVALVLFTAGCSASADIDEAQRWAKSCGLGDLRMFVSGDDARKIVVSEPRINGQPWGDPTVAERAMLKRQASVVRAVRCMEPHAEAAGVKIEYPVSVAH